MKDGGGFFIDGGPETEGESVDEQRINTIVEKIMDEASERRRILTLQELCEMKFLRPSLEQFFPDVQAYFYAIDGMLSGENLTGAMLAGHCMLIFAASQEQANDLAHEGLLSTVKYAQEYGDSNDAFLAEQEARAANAGIITSASHN